MIGMDAKLLAGLCVVGLLVTGCSDGGTTAASAPPGAAADVAPAVVVAGEGWSKSGEHSAIDGTVVAARKIFEFGEKRATFVAEFRCIAATGSVDLSIEAYLGDPSQPEDGSEFVREAGLNLFGQAYVVPVGRAKPSGLEPRALGDLFFVSDEASNRIELRRISSSSDIARLPQELKDALDDDINIPRVVQDMLPLSLELNNGAGRTELVLGASPQVREVLTACGGDGDLVKPEAVARLYEERRKGEEEARAEEERKVQAVALQTEQARQREAEERARLAAECRDKGGSSSGTLDCAGQFPEDFAAFNATIDAIYAVPRKHGFLCSSRGSREDLVQMARFQGTNYVRRYVQLEWCGGNVDMNEP